MPKQKKKSRKREKAKEIGDPGPPPAVKDGDPAKNGDDALANSPTPAAPPMSVEETCDLIAELSESIVEEPDKAFVSIELDLEDGVKKKGPSRMQQLLSVARRQETADERTTAQLAIMSLLAVFKDILPDYRIRIPSAKEMAVKVAKETKKVWDYERGLLHHYQEFLKLLEKSWDQETEKDFVAVTAIVSLAELLKSAFHFNFRSNLISAVVRQMSSSLQVVRKAW